MWMFIALNEHQLVSRRQAFHAEFKAFLFPGGMQVSHEDAGLQFSRLSAQAAKAAHNARMAKKRGRSDEEESCEGDGATSGGVSVGDGFHATFAASFASHGALQTRRDVFTPHKLGDALASVETQTPPKQTSRQQNHQQNHHRLKQSESQPQTVRLPASSCTEPESAKEPDTAPRDRTGASARKLFTSRHPDTPVANRVRFDYSASTPTPRKKNPTFGLCDRAIAVPLTDKAKLKYDLAVNAPAHGHYAYFGTPVSAASASGSNANNPADPNANVNGGSNQSATGTASDSRKGDLNVRREISGIKRACALRRRRERVSLNFARSVHAATLFTTLTGLPVHDMPICPTSSTLVRRLTANPATTSLSPTPSSRTANSSAASRSQFLSFCTKPESFPATQTSDLLLSRASPCLPGGGSARNNTATSVLTLRAGGGSSFASPSPQRKRRDLLLEADSCLETQQVLRRASKLQPRSILRSPYKVLDAPELQDDFYLNLVDWSGSNILGVGLVCMRMEPWGTRLRVSAGTQRAQWLQLERTAVLWKSGTLSRNAKFET
ncbi:hypothetical protein BC830DRAFT_1085219 [Chytriomyces sp. MP71]|nr:hypothetical protein BC830DRAFT_1085219 [Chytriomyces sp. MP71]